MTDRVWLELLLLRIYVYGWSAVATRGRALISLRQRDRPTYQEVVAALREQGYTIEDIKELMGDTHQRGCGCWTCVLALHGAVVRHQAEMKGREESHGSPPAQTLPSG